MRSAPLPPGACWSFSEACDPLEPQASARLDATTGVRHAYVFGEYYNDRLQLVTNAMHVEASSFVAGLAVDF